MTPWTVACQVPLSMEFSRLEYCSGLHSFLQGTFPAQELNVGLQHDRQILYQLSHQESPNRYKLLYINLTRIYCIAQRTILKVLHNLQQKRIRKRIYIYLYTHTHICTHTYAHAYIKLNHFAIHLKHCRSTTLQLKKVPPLPKLDTR